jgi:hypothetical protein
MRTRREIILESMNSMLASAQLEAKPGITLKKFVYEMEFLVEYPKKGDGGKLTPAQIKYIKSVLDENYRTARGGTEIYYLGQGIMF